MTEKLYKFTFKKDKWGAFETCVSSSIKYNSKDVGNIVRLDNNKWKVSLQFPASDEKLKKNPNCPWMWVRVKQEFDTEEEARLWLNENRKDIIPMMYIED